MLEVCVKSLDTNSTWQHSFSLSVELYITFLEFYLWPYIGITFLLNFGFYSSEPANANNIILIAFETSLSFTILPSKCFSWISVFLNLWKVPVSNQKCFYIYVIVSFISQCCFEQSDYSKCKREDERLFMAETEALKQKGWSESAAIPTYIVCSFVFIAGPTLCSR